MGMTHGWIRVAWVLVMLACVVLAGTSDGLFGLWPR